MYNISDSVESLAGLTTKPRFNLNLENSLYRDTGITYQPGVVQWHVVTHNERKWKDKETECPSRSLVAAVHTLRVCS